MIKTLRNRKCLFKFIIDPQRSRILRNFLQVLTRGPESVYHMFEEISLLGLQINTEETKYMFMSCHRLWDRIIA